jgi:acyl-CoA reductase-like NAD-dependent aldehyde dehydrogenase
VTSREGTLPDLSDLVDGERSAPAVELGRWLEDPNTGEQVQAVVATDDATLDRAVAAAARVHAEGSWSRLSDVERADWLERYADALAPRCEEVARLESLTTGAPVTQTGMLSFIVHAAFRLVAEQLRSGLLRREYDGPTGAPVEVRRLPLGPALALVPWNAPAPMAAHKVASALGAGCPTILKPSDFAPHGSGALADAAVEIGLPPGVFQLVHGDVRAGSRLVEDPRVRAVSFTGGLAGGRAIAAASVETLRPVQLELGGHNALVVMPDASAEAVAAAVVGLMTTLNGQWCRSLGRLLVPADRHDELLEAVLAALAQVRLGHSLDPETQMGPIVHSAHLQHLQERIAALGGKPHSSTPLPGLGGNYLAPTLLTGVDPGDALHEVFGPVATVHPYGSLDEAVALANGTPYGLEGYVVGTDTDEALAVARRVRAGGVKVNGVSPLSLHLMAPRPAWGLSGLGVEGTAETVEFFTGEQVVGVEGSLP